MSLLGRRASLVTLVALTACSSRATPLADPSPLADPTPTAEATVDAGSPPVDAPEIAEPAIDDWIYRRRLTSPLPTPPIARRPRGRLKPIVLTDAALIEIVDAWTGLGCAHYFHVTLTATATHDAWRGEAILQSNWPDSLARREAALTRATVVKLQRAVDAARAAIARTPDEPADELPLWTDDYPSGSIAFTGGKHSYRIAFTDQHRKLTLAHDGALEPLDPPQPYAHHEALSNAYGDVLSELGMRPWIESAYGQP